MNVFQTFLTWLGIKKQNTQFVATPEIEAAVQTAETGINNVEAAITAAIPNIQALVALAPELEPELTLIITGFQGAKVTISGVEATVNAAISAATGKPFPPPVAVPQAQVTPTPTPTPH